MTAFELTLVAAAGVAAGLINTVVGSGTLVTFPALLAVGLPPVSANVANNIGLAPGSVAGAVGYRSQLRVPRAVLFRLAGLAALGGASGAVILIVSPSEAFAFVAPVMIGIAVCLVLVQPRLEALVRRRPRVGGAAYGGPAVAVAVLLTSVYGGYFGAGQGVILFALLSVLVQEPLQRINGLKNVLQGVDNLTSAAFFAVLYPVPWLAVAVLGSGAVVGGLLGARVGMRLGERTIRILVAVLGVVGLVSILVGDGIRRRVSSVSSGLTRTLRKQ